MIQNLLVNVEGNKDKLTLFIGTMFSFIIRDSNYLASEIMNIESEFVNMIGQLSFKEQVMVAAFLLEGLSI